MNECIGWGVEIWICCIDCRQKRRLNSISNIRKVNENKFVIDLSACWLEENKNELYET